MTRSPRGENGLPQTSLSIPVTSHSFLETLLSKTISSLSFFEETYVFFFYNSPLGCRKNIV